MSNRKRYDTELETLNDSLTEMGAASADAVYAACLLLTAQNDSTAAGILDGDKKIDGMEQKIEQHCLTLLLRQQPVATDLRRISAALKLVTDLERIGDHAADIAEISQMLEQGWQSRIPVQADINRMAQVALEMVRAAIAAFVGTDTEKAEAVIARDDTVDGLFDTIKKELGAYIAKNPGEIDAALDLLMVIKYLERLGDHAVNIAEWVRFLKTGFYRGRQIV
ncbi:MAG: phosphate signaling complex protein PhoU [Faecalibacterium sp.]|jgi:phosphate transport system protein|nr:phosphate signaling complex protein PhoU [Faecalibacterium sp.]